MNLDSQLLLGLVLIAIGIILAVLAYTFLVSRREDEAEAEKPKPHAPDMPVQSAESETPLAQAQTAAPPTATAAPAPDEPAPPSTAAQPASAVTVQPGPSAATASSLKRTFPVAALLRDEVTGKLVVKIGDKEYASAKELRESKDYGRVEFASADLARWFGAPPSATVAARVEADRADRKEPVKPKSMIEQINEILERRLAAAPGVQRGVRLMEGSAGALRVLIGLQGYNFDDVPDAEVRRIIREAVAEWEAKR